MSVKSIPQDTPDDQVCQVTPASTNVVELNDGAKIPRVGLGVYQTTPGKEAYDSCREALRVGYGISIVQNCTEMRRTLENN